MKTQQLRERLQKDRPMTTISIRMPEDVVEDLKRVAPLLGFSGYQPLIRAYIGQGLRQDLERLDQNPGLERLIESLRRQGISEESSARRWRRSRPTDWASPKPRVELAAASRNGPGNRPSRPPGRTIRPGGRINL